MPSRRTSALHAYRWSQSATPYFITCCTEGRQKGLAAIPVAGILRDIVVASDARGDTRTHAFTVMPDHVHWLFTLGSRLSLGRVIARLKAKSRNAMAAAGLDWQRDFFEHRLRIGEAIEPFGLYVFLNPHRAGLVSSKNRWAHWRCPESGMFRFLSQLNPDETPPTNWIGEPVPKGLAVGE